MAHLQGTTITLLEVPWSGHRFATTDSFLPESTIQPFVHGLALNWGARLIYRGIRDAEDLTCWCAALNRSRLGVKILWIAGHGYAAQSDKHAIDIIAPDHLDPEAGNAITPNNMKRAVAKAGRVAGLIVDSCSWAQNAIRLWAPSNVMWALSFAKDVDLLDALHFTAKTIVWIHDDRDGPPANGEVARRRYVAGVRHGRIREIENRTSHVVMARQLGACFYYRVKGQWCGGAADDLT